MSLSLSYINTLLTSARAASRDDISLFLVYFTRVSVSLRPARTFAGERQCIYPHDIGHSSGGGEVFFPSLCGELEISQCGVGSDDF